jgi:hypothetical protein
MPYLSTRFKHATWAEKLVVGLYPPPDDKWDTTHQEYTYTFVGPERQVDPVLVGMQTTILELQCEHTEFAPIEVTVRNLTLCPPLWPVTKKNAHIPIKMYAFRRSGDEFPRAVPVSIANRNKKGVLSPDRILVRIDGMWRPVKEWLTDWLQDRSQFWKGSKLEAQQKWWKKMQYQTGKFFPFWRLPKELRLQILQHALGSDIHPRVHYMLSTKNYRVILGSPGENTLWTYNTLSLYYEDLKQYEQRSDFPNYAVFRVSKQFYKEAMTAGWVGTPKQFSWTCTLKDVLGCPNPPPVPNWLSIVYLEFSMSEYFDMFGVQVTPSIRINPARCQGKVLQQMNTLTELTFHFPNPHESHDYENPWGMTVKWNESFQAVIKGMRKYPCWKTIVDWILVFAFPFIKHVPKVHLRGCIKTAVKHKWAHLLDIEFANRNLSAGEKRTAGFDYGHAVEAIQSISGSTENLQVS